MIREAFGGSYLTKAFSANHQKRVTEYSMSETFFDHDDGDVRGGSKAVPSLRVVMTDTGLWRGKNANEARNGEKVRLLGATPLGKAGPTAAARHDLLWPIGPENRPKAARHRRPPRLRKGRGVYTARFTPPKHYCRP